MKVLTFDQKSKNAFAGETSSSKILNISPSSGLPAALIFLQAKCDQSHARREQGLRVGLTLQRPIASLSLLGDCGTSRKGKTHHHEAHPYHYPRVS